MLDQLDSANMIAGLIEQRGLRHGNNAVVGRWTAADFLKEQFCSPKVGTRSLYLAS
jgi:hypothetical protein